MKTDRGSVDGKDINFRADSEETARRLFNQLDRDRVTIEGGTAAKIEQVGDVIGEVFDGLSRPGMGVAGWAFAVVECWLTAISFSAFAPAPSLELPFAIAGVVLVLMIKEGAGRWAKADNLNSPKLADFYRMMVFGGMAIILAIGTAFQAAKSDDADSGVISIEDQVDREAGEIRKLESAAEEMVRPADKQVVLLLDFTRALAREVRNTKGEKTGITVAQAVTAGERGQDGNMPSSFCAASDERQIYLDKYCPALVDMEKNIQRRKDYDAKLAEIEKRKAANEDLRKTKPKKASGLVLAEKVAGGDGRLWGWLGSALMVGVFGAFMVFCVYVSKRHPKGVTETLAQLNQKAAPPPAPGGT